MSRNGFSLLEVMIVTGILALLAGFLLLALAGSFTSGERLDTIKEIAELEVGLSVFTGRYNFTPPSRLTLARFPQQVDEQSRTVLQQMLGPDFMKEWNTSGIEWHTGMTGPVTLEGDQCLVFFLQGADGRADRLFPFKPDRLQTRSGQVFDSYYDPWRFKPYAYFSKTNTLSWEEDCPALSVSPYRQGSVPPKPYQIISAGKNGLFGTNGGNWTPGSANLVYPPRAGGSDDLASFHGRRPLGAR